MEGAMASLAEQMAAKKAVEESTIQTGMGSASSSPDTVAEVATEDTGHYHPEDRKGQYFALRKRKLVLKDGTVVRPDSDGYFVADTKEKKEALKEFSSMYGMLEYVE